MRALTILLIVLMFSASALAKTDIVIDPDYDPRIALRVIVLPALKDRSLKRVNERTISAMLSTELVQVYEVLDLLRFEAALSNQRLTMEKAFTEAQRQTVRDISGVDALVTTEVYRWDPGRGGIPFITAKKGTVGIRMRMVDPYTGRVYWSVNRLDDVKPGSDFLDVATAVFRDVTDELDDQLLEIVGQFNESDSYAELAAKQEPWQRMMGYSRRTFSGEKDGVERGFMPVLTPEAAYIAAYRGYGYQPSDSVPAYQSPVSPDVLYEDAENERNSVLPPLVPPAVYDSQLRATIDSLKTEAGVDTLNPEFFLPPFEQPEAPPDTSAGEQ